MLGAYDVADERRTDTSTTPAEEGAPGGASGGASATYEELRRTIGYARQSELLKPPDPRLRGLGRVWSFFETANDVVLQTGGDVGFASHDVHHAEHTPDAENLAEWLSGFKAFFGVAGVVGAVTDIRSDLSEVDVGAPEAGLMPMLDAVQAAVDAVSATLSLVTTPGVASVGGTLDDVLGNLLAAVRALVEGALALDTAIKLRSGGELATRVRAHGEADLDGCEDAHAARFLELHKAYCEGRLGLDRPPHARVRIGHDMPTVAAAQREYQELREHPELARWLRAEHLPDTLERLRGVAGAEVFLSALDAAGSVCDFAGTFTVAVDGGTTKAAGKGLKAVSTLGRLGAAGMRRWTRVKRLATARRHVDGKARGTGWCLKMFLTRDIDSRVHEMELALSRPGADGAYRSEASGDKWGPRFARVFGDKFRTAEIVALSRDPDETRCEELVYTALGDGAAADVANARAILAAAHIWAPEPEAFTAMDQPQQTAYVTALMARTMAAMQVS